jgi:hypothetical protein
MNISKVCYSKNTSVGFGYNCIIEMITMVFPCSVCACAFEVPLGQENLFVYHVSN